MKMLLRSLAIGLALATAGVSEAVSALDPCEAPNDVAGAVTALSRVGATLRPGSRLDVLAIGSATLFGPEASLSPGTITSQALGHAPPGTTPGTPATPQAITLEPSEKAFPKQMAKALRLAVPGVDVAVTVRGGRGMSAIEMLALVRSELALGRYQLVLWQTGTVEAVRNVPPGEFAQTLADGVDTVHQAGADLVLIDPQFSRFLQTNSNLDPYAQALQQAASMPGVLLFHRYDLMRSWANDGQIDLERTARVDRQKAVETLHACLGAHLARLVLGAARS